MADEKATDKVAKKTSPDAKTAVDNTEYFEKNYTVYLPGTDKLTDELREQQVGDVRQSAMQRGVRPTGDVSLTEERRDGANVFLSYKVPVEPASEQGEREVYVQESVQHEADKKN